MDTFKNPGEPCYSPSLSTAAILDGACYDGRCVSSDAYCFEEVEKRRRCNVSTSYVTFDKANNRDGCYRVQCRDTSSSTCSIFGDVTGCSYNNRDDCQTK